ncbi:histidine kinase N-terminal domain-containing protein [Fredinandcohnia sp. QZ13]|uniref:histidine kinase N-terminal domain-containing protein n=1 Tax=Fredinandcohnia sp. QZ13 TaxID=3073144 RepID=UPI00285363AF|nr:histidine kinase N-terminal domain-containing protein [Fredinandcohnia sp. QZ13]MDR4886129.1 histidine kinase N-terminal domain-containing protein [Fredinandcohnia sp. QZ13]
MNPVICELVYFLESNLSIFLKSWKDKTVMSENDFHKDKLILNGLTMFEMIKNSLINPIDEEKLKSFAYKLAEERVESNINIGEFVYNVNLGRTEILKYIYRSNIGHDQLDPVFEEVNRIFDLFSYHAVSKYTEMKEKMLQEKIQYIDQSHQERLTILGQMASTFVHEFRNPLTAVIGFVKLIGNENPDIKYLDIISHELNQLNYKISQFLHVSKKELIDSNENQVSLLDLFTEITEFIYASILDSEVKVHTDIESDIIITVNKDEIRQVLLNVLMNSIDALKQRDYDRNIWINGHHINNQIVLSIMNNGPAIPKESLATIFEPFYTTKEFGTGIGLFVCKKIIEKHGGTIGCTSNSIMTEFKIVLPVYEQ